MAVTEERRAEIEKQAIRVNDISQNYHLSHATFACERLIQDLFREYTVGKREELTNKLKDAIRRNDTENAQFLTDDLASVNRNKCRIYIDYIKTMDRTSGRLTKHGDSLVINLPEVLLRESRDKNGEYVVEIVKILRGIMAHELGHIALNPKQLFECDSLQGSNIFSKNDDFEQEANIFANNLLSLRRERNETFYKNGVYKSF